MSGSEDLLLGGWGGSPWQVPPAAWGDSHTFLLSVWSRWPGTSHPCRPAASPPRGPGRLLDPVRRRNPPPPLIGPPRPPSIAGASAGRVVSGSSLSAAPPPTIPELGGGDVIIRALAGGATVHNGTKTSGPSQTLSDAAVARAINSVLSAQPANPDPPAPAAWYAGSSRASLPPPPPDLLPPLRPLRGEPGAG